MKDYLRLNNEVLNTYMSTGLIDREKDVLATKKYFLDEVNRNTMFFHTLEEQIGYLVREGYYEKGFLELYDSESIARVFDIAYEYKFRFPTFMSASKFYSGYAMTTRDGESYLERLEDRVSIVALYLAQGDSEKAEKWVRYIMEAFQPATPTFLNSGKSARGELVSCFKLAMDDSMNNIAHNIGNALQLSKLGGGVGIDLTDLRCARDPIKEILNRASGVMPVAKLLENSFSYANQLGQRAGSGVVWLNIFHGDIESFLSSKKANADDKIRLATLSTGVVIPDIFFELMKADKDIVLFSPYDIKKEYGKRMSEISITEMYYDLLDNPNIRKLKRINARKLYNEVKKVQFESGYPFEMFDDNTNTVHPLKKIGKVKISNLCTEIMQLQETSVINDYNEDDEIGIDVSCNLGSIDIHASVETDFEDLISSAVQMLTVVSTMTSIDNVPSVQRGNKLMNSIGLGVMNLHGHLATNGIHYGSAESLQFVDAYFTALNYFSIKASMEIAKEKGETFYRYEDSDYASGEFFDKYLDKELEITHDSVKQALGNVPVITIEMWEELKKDVTKHGLFNAYRLAVAPTGSISYVRSCTASMSPITERVEVRDYADSRTIYPMPNITNENKHLFVEAYDMSMYDIIDLYAVAQKHVDQAMSLTLYVKDNWTTEQLAKVYIYAWSKGIKSIYYVRQRLQTVEQSIAECESCQI